MGNKNIIEMKIKFIFERWILTSRFVSRVSINGKELSAMNNLPGGNEYRVANVAHHNSSLRYQPSSWKNNSGGSSGASTGVSPNHSSNEDHNGEERLV